MRRAGVAIVGLLLAAAACSGDDDPAAERAPTTVVDAPTSTSADPPSTTTAPAAPAFEAQIGALTSAQLPASWRPGCPHPVESLRLVRASHWGFDGAVHEGAIVVDAAVADAIVRVLGALFDARYPIERMEPVDAYAGSDDASMAANNTSAFNCRPVTGGTAWSEHAYGRAVDLNPLQNPWVRGSTVIPAESARYADRTSTDLGVIREGDAAVTAFAAEGWTWGGHWATSKDYQHFSLSGR